MNEKPNVASPFLMMFPSYRIPKAAKQLMRKKFPSCSNSFKLYQRIQGKFYSYWFIQYYYWSP